MIRTMRKSGVGGSESRVSGLPRRLRALGAALDVGARSRRTRGHGRPRLTDTTPPGSTHGRRRRRHASRCSPAATPSIPRALDSRSSWYDCSSATPAVRSSAWPRPAALRSAPRLPAPYTVTSADQGAYITVYETDPNPLALQIDQNASNTLAVPAAPPPPPPPPAPTNKSAAVDRGLDHVRIDADRGSPAVDAVAATATPTAGRRCSQSQTNCSRAESAAPPTSSAKSDVGGYIFLTQTATATNAGGGRRPRPPPRPVRADHDSRPRRFRLRTRRPRGTAVPTVSGTPQVGATLTGAHRDDERQPHLHLPVAPLPGAVVHGDPRRDRHDLQPQSPPISATRWCSQRPGPMRAAAVRRSRRRPRSSPRRPRRRSRSPRPAWSPVKRRR